jgi:predicted O-methyltransferase YrrM
LYKEAGSSVSIYDLNLKLAGVREMVTDIIGDSAQSAAQFPDNSLDFVFIDASHDYDSVKRDIKAWLPKVRKPNGIIAGHDYCEVWPGVIKAVHEEFGLDLEIVQSDWVWCKTFS